MSAEVLVITPEATPGTGGLADYALRAVEEWGGAVRARFASSADQLPACEGKVLLHYSAYGFDRLGYPRALLRKLHTWKSEGRGRLVLMLHEIWTFWPLLNKNRLIQRMHRTDLGNLVSIADAVFTSTPSQAAHLLKLAPTSAIQVLPVSSTIRRLASAHAREAGLAILFGLQGSRLNALRQMRKDLQSLARAKVVRKLITIGQSQGADSEEHALLSPLKFAENFEMRGPLSEGEVSTQLARASFAVSAQDELSVYKSGTFMAYAAHGLNIISPYADSFAPEPICWLTRADDLVRGVATQELIARAQHLERWQARISSWPQIARQFAAALKVE